MKLLRIKDLVLEVGIPAETIRFYERSGLLPEAKRTDNNYRVYDLNDVSRLRFIRNCRALDMSLDEIRELIDFIGSDDESTQGSKDCTSVRDIVAEHLVHVQSRLKSLAMLEKQLENLLLACDHPESVACCGIVRSLFTDVDMPNPGEMQGVHTT